MYNGKCDQPIRDEYLQESIHVSVLNSEIIATKPLSRILD